MAKYKIEQRIFTLADNAIIKDGETPASFTEEDIFFYHQDFDYGSGWPSDFWIAQFEIEANNYHEAFTFFSKKMIRIIPRISLVSQVYVDYLLEPFLIHKIGSDIAFFRYTKDVKSGELMFMEEQRNALTELLIDSSPVSEEFFFYWNDAVNSTGYSAKLLLMFSAVEALCKKRDKVKYPKKENLMDDILGEDLRKTIFERTSGLRNRLSHGDYLSSSDSKENYVEMVHKKVIEYFNSNVFSKEYLPVDVVNPQRHPFGNKLESKSFIQSKEGNSEFNLLDLIKSFVQEDGHGISMPDIYRHHFTDSEVKNY